MAVSRITLQIQPGARRNEVVGFDEAKRLRVRVTAPPEDGKANVAVIALLTDILGVTKGSVSIERGHAARLKIVRIDGLGANALRARLAP